MRFTPAARLIAFRERSGKSPNEVAELSGLTSEYYYDLEHYDDLIDAIALSTLTRVCTAVGCTSADLFAGEESTRGNAISFEDLRQLVNADLASRGITLAAFEDIAGWELTDFLGNATAAWKWNVQCLIDVCAMVKADWISVLPLAPP